MQSLWSAVDEVWRYVRQLGGGMPPRAHALLHAHLLCQQLFGGTQHTARLQVPDAAPALVMLLAAKTRAIAFVPIGPQLSRVGPTAQAVWGCDCLPLEELVLTGVDMSSELDFLLQLLPCCKRLLVLKLGGNCTTAVLEAARSCPLKVLHLSERMAWQPRMTEDDLGKFFFGSVLNVKNALNDVQHGRQIDFISAWPGLTDVCMGWCRVSIEFLLLLLIAFPRLQYLNSQLIDMTVVIKQFVDSISHVTNQKLSLRVNTVISGNFSKTYHNIPGVSKLHLLNVTDVEVLLWEILEASVHLPHLQILSLAIIPGLPPRLPSLSLRKGFVNFGKHIKELHLGRGYGGWAYTLLNLFPCLQKLRITGDVMQIPDETTLKVVFPSVSILECVCSNTAESLPYLVSVFPNLEILTLKSHCGDLALQWEELNELVNLRNLTLLGTLVKNVANLCLVPRDTTEKRHWDLHVVPGSVTPSDLNRLRWCGWTCFFVKDYP